LKPIAFLSRGFRPFFLGASVFAMLAMANWMAVYLVHFPLELNGVNLFQWHAHEMIFGYAMAVIAGFLLTAAWNWTGRKTASGTGLAVLFLLWLLARALMMKGTGLLAWATAADLAFMAGLAFAVGKPVIQARQTRQAPVLLLLTLLAAARLLFFLGAEGMVQDGVRIAVHGGLYLVLGMVLFMGRRVIPFFTQRGVGYEVELRNERWNDIATVTVYPLYMFTEILLPYSLVGAILAGALLILNTLRVMGWHTMGIWQKPLLWGLFLSFVMINLGFLLRALMPVTAVPPYLHMHAYAVGGVGMITLSMMARVTLGHTGRDIHQAPRVMALILVGMLLTATIRIFLPLIDSSHYGLWIGAAGAAWIASFFLFTVVFSPMLLRRRVDEQAEPKPAKPGSE
jgi:uncharacterized protein involved in response to NO